MRITEPKITDNGDHVIIEHADGTTTFVENADLVCALCGARIWPAPRLVRSDFSSVHADDCPDPEASDES